MEQTKLKQKYFSRMLKMLILLVVFSNSSLTTNAQVTIGNEEQPVTGSLLQIKSKVNITDDGANSDRGLALPRVTLSEKKQLFPMFLANPDDSTSGANADYTTNKSAIDKVHTGLIVYNLTENDDKELCLGLNQWDGEQWNCFQSKMGNAIASIDNCDNITFSGVYQDKVSLNSGNYMNITLNVTKAGAYTITARASYAGDNSVDNGYYFTTTGVFLTTGTYALQVPGNGTPLKYTPSSNPSGDVITIFMNDKQLTLADGSTTCPKNIVVEDSSVKPLYTMSCRQTKVRGVYELNKELIPENNYIEVVLNVTAPYGATYIIKTNTVDGIYFQGSGTLTSGTQTVQLQGYGKPNSINNKVLTITSNSISDVSTCNATVVVSYPMKSMFAFGYYENSAGYLGQPGSGLRKMIDATANFGNTENSTVKVVQYSTNQTFYPYQTLSGGGSYNPATIKTYLDQKPDIVLTGFDLALTGNDLSLMVSYLVDYLQKGGVLIFICERQATVESFFKALYPKQTISADWTTTISMSLNYVNDDVLNGPFGDIRGLLWGNDTAGASGVKGLPADDDLIILSQNSSGTPIILKHKKYNLLFIGEGGFNANLSGGTGSTAGTTSSTSYPLAIDTNYKPITRTGWSGGNTVENSRLIANAIAWAIKQAQFNGINTP